MSSKEFFGKIGQHLNNEDFNKFVDTVPEFDMDDALFTEFENTFMTRERALADKQIVGKLKREHLDPIDKEIGSILKVMGYENAHDIEKQGDTYKKIALITQEIPKALEKAGKGSVTSEDVKKKLEQKDGIIAELTKKFETANSDWANEKTSMQAAFDDKIHNIHLDSELDKMSQNYTFAEAYEKTRPTLQGAILGELKRTNKLKLAEKDGKTDIQILDDNGSPRFNGNTPVTVKSLLDEAYKPFLKQSNADGNGQQPPGQATPTRFAVPAATPGASPMPRRNTA